MTTRALPSRWLAIRIAPILACSACAWLSPADRLPPVERDPAAEAAMVEAMKTTVETLAVKGVGRHVGNRYEIDQAADWISRWIGRQGIRVRERSSVSRTLIIAKNLSVELGPPDAPRYVIGAHYDSRRNTRGADDDASGVAVLIELVRRLRSRPLAVGIEVVFYSMTQPPFEGTPEAGATRHVEDLTKEGVRVLGMLSVDSVGFYSTDAGSQRWPDDLADRGLPETGDFVAAAGRSPQDVPLLDALAKAAPGIPGMSFERIEIDPASPFVKTAPQATAYWDAGIPAVLLTDTASFRNAQNGLWKDDPETLDYARMVGVVELIERFVAVVDAAYSKNT